MKNNLTNTVLKSKNEENLYIKMLSKTDVLALQKFNENLSAKTRSQFLPHKYNKKTILQFVKRNKKGIDLIYVALSQNKIIGYFFLWNFNKTFPILGIGIADVFQGKGIGKKLMSILIQDAKNAKKEGILLTAVLANEVAFQFYLKMGFEYLGDTDNIAGDGRIVREKMMYLAIKKNTKPENHDFKPPIL